MAQRYTNPAETRDYEALIAAYTTRKKASAAEIKRFFGRSGFTGFTLLQWATTFAEVRVALRKSASTKAGFQKSSLTPEEHTNETPPPN